MPALGKVVAVEMDRKGQASWYNFRRKIGKTGLCWEWGRNDNPGIVPHFVLDSEWTVWDKLR